MLNKSVSKITKNLSTMVAQLRTHAEHMETKAEVLDGKISKIAVKRLDVLTERDRAKAAADKIEALLA